jgi:hypothetical protein
MTPRTCAACNVTATSETPLKSCPCKQVSHCDRICQGRHWKTHKLTCIAAAKTKTKVDEDQDDNTILDASKGLKDGHGNIVFDGVKFPTGTFVDYFVLPTSDSPNAHYEAVILDPEMTIWLANLPEEERHKFEKEMVDGDKCGASNREVFDKITKGGDADAINKLKEPVDQADTSKPCKLWLRGTRPPKSKTTAIMSKGPVCPCGSMNVKI